MRFVPAPLDVNNMVIYPRRGLLVRICALVVAAFLLHTYFTAKDDIHQRYPLITRIIHQSPGHGGAWLVPSTWSIDPTELSTNITHAARVVSEYAKSNSDSNLDLSNIPRIVHQSWKSTSIDNFPPNALPAVETWLDYINDPRYPPTAYFLWDDQGVEEFVREFQPDLLEYFNALPRPVIKSDLFRILVSKWIGGVYADIDTTPLEHPSSWVSQPDVEPWTDEVTNTTYGQHNDSSQPVGLILGIEADTDEDSDSFWRMGYSYPVQLTQWSLASASHHPVLDQFLETFRHRFRSIIDDSAELDPLTVSFGNVRLDNADPLELSGPVAITEATMSYLTSKTGLRWQALSGLTDGGRSKLVDDVLILPITGFSPGRGRYGNMGSRPYSHPDARLRHDAQGSWRKWDLKVEVGKACRSVFGRCRDWSKIS